MKKSQLVSDNHQVSHTMHVCNHMIPEESKNCVSREEFESLQQELNYWQNTTINILKKYLFDREGKLKRNGNTLTYKVYQHDSINFMSGIIAIHLIQVRSLTIA